MLVTNLKIAFRNLIKFKVYAFINIAGLSLGLAVSMLILMFVSHEFSYDRFHRNHERIYQVFSQLKIGENNMQTNAYPVDFGPSVKSQNPHVEDYVRVMSTHQKIVIKNPEKPKDVFYEDNFLYADPSLFQVFSFELAKGNAAHALGKPNAVVISERSAKKYFGADEPIGKTLVFQNKHLLEVTGVSRNTPSNSSLEFDFLVSVASFPVLNDVDKSRWEAGGSFKTYLLLDSPGASKAVEKTIAAAAAKKQSDGVEQTYSLQNLASIHLGNNFNGDGNARLIYIFSGIALLVLVLALFNYMSLTTARATLRAKEVGVRKVVGSGRRALVGQFYTESVLICAVAFITALLLVELLRHPFNDLLGLTIDISFLYSRAFLSFIALLFAAVTLIAGSYPALVLSGFAPLAILKGSFSGAYQGSTVRKTFIVFQFAVTIALIICTLVVKNQVAFMQTMKLGFDKDQILVIPFPESRISQAAALRNEIAGYAGVKSASAASRGFFGSYDISFTKNKTTGKDIALVYMAVDRHFVKTLGLEWKVAPAAGTLQNRSYVLLNEVAVKELGIQRKPLGMVIDEFEEVGGILKNFHFTSPQNGIKPIALRVQTDTTSADKSTGSSGLIYARLDPKADVKAQVEVIRKSFESYYPGRPFEYHFLDDAFNKNFQTEIRMSRLFSVFTGLAIFIACMGLFGLVTFTAETRVREIGIRKVLGASVDSIVAMLSGGFIKLVAVSILIAFPVAWYFMQQWLEEFTYRIEIPIWIYLAAGIAAILVAIITVSLQTIRAALMNPVKSLKNE